MSKISRAIVSLTLFVLFTNPASATVFQGKRHVAGNPSAQRRVKVRTDPARERREKSFELVWQTVNEENFDPTFGGVNWMAAYSRYSTRVARTASDQELYILLQQMLNEIPQSHFAIIPPENIPRIRVKRTQALKAEGQRDEAGEDVALGDEETESDNAVATQMLNGIGVDVRLLNGQIVIMRGDAERPASRAGLRTGFILKRVDNI